MAALSYLDTHASVSRRGTDGVEPIATGGLVAALFDHRTSRAGIEAVGVGVVVGEDRALVVAVLPAQRRCRGV
jgi:TrwC relaxase